MNRSVAALTGLFCLVLSPSVPHAQQASQPTSIAHSSSGLLLAPTAHPRLPREMSQFWLSPDRDAATLQRAAFASLATAARLTVDKDFPKALSLVSQPVAQQGPLAQYAAYYAGLSQMRLDRAADALATFQKVQAARPVGYLWEAAALGEAEALEALRRYGDAVPVYERLLKGRLTDVEDVYMRLGRTAVKLGDLTKAAEAYAHVYYEFPLGENAGVAAAELSRMDGLIDLTPDSPRFRAELGRAERYFAAKRYADAEDIFEKLEGMSSDRSQSDLVRLRLAECRYYRKRYRDARDLLKPLVENSSHAAEALHFSALTARGLGDTTTFVNTLQRVVAQFPTDSWTEASLDVLATHYVRADDDATANALFQQLVERFPRGDFTERASWKAGWAAFRSGDYEFAARTFEQASSNFPRSDYRPSWLYWAGRAREARGEAAEARMRYGLAIADYANSYYGRLASKRISESAGSAVESGRLAGDQYLPAEAPPNSPTIRALLAADMVDDAVKELRYAQLVWGDSPAIQATLAYANQQLARRESGMRQLQLVRAGMNGMRRAYPQFLTETGDTLPRDVLTVIYPLAFWDLIREQAVAKNLDPYLVAALVAQESTFAATVRSAANAYGLMQLLPSTARSYARKLNLPYSTRLLTNPEANIRIGTAYLADKIREFGDLHLALASYNAGEKAVRRWQAERPGLGIDEFIDDIPYPETQGYVKKILGTADDYRRLYGGSSGRDSLELTMPPTATAAVAAAQSTRATTAARPKASSPKASGKGTVAPRKSASKVSSSKASAPRASAAKASVPKAAAPRPSAAKPPARRTSAR